MPTFDLFLSKPKFASFAEVAVSAERILHIAPSACVLMGCKAIGLGDMLRRFTINN